MKITSLNLRTLVIGLTAALLSPALMAQSLQVVANTTPVTQASPWKSLNVRISTSVLQTAYVQAIWNHDSARFSVVSVTSYAPHECRLVNNKITLTAQTPNFGLPFPNNATVDFCQVWLKLKPGAAAGVSSVYYSAIDVTNTVGNSVGVASIGATITVQ